jgi:hypothetical protein
MFNQIVLKSLFDNCFYILKKYPWEEDKDTYIYRFENLENKRIFLQDRDHNVISDLSAEDCLIRGLKSNVVLAENHEIKIFYLKKSMDEMSVLYSCLDGNENCECGN